MSDFIVWGLIAVLMWYMALRGPKDAPFLRLLWLWFGFSMVLFGVLDVRGGHPGWLKWPLFAVLLLIGVCSYLRDEVGQRTRYAVIWSLLRKR